MLSYRASGISEPVLRGNGELVGREPKTVAEILGHVSAEFSLDAYTHVTAGMKKAAQKISVSWRASDKIRQFRKGNVSGADVCAAAFGEGIRCNRQIRGKANRTIVFWKMGTTSRRPALLC